MDVVVVGVLDSVISEVFSKLNVSVIIILIGKMSIAFISSKVDACNFLTLLLCIAL